MFNKLKIFFKENAVWLNALFVALLTALVNALYKSKFGISVFFIIASVLSLFLVLFLIFVLIGDEHSIRNVKIISSSRRYLRYLNHLKDSSNLKDASSFNHFYDCIMQMQRVLLDCNQMDLRIKLGLSIYNNPLSTPEQKIHVCLDLIGWTYILKGETLQGLKYIDLGLTLINQELEKAPFNSSLYYHYVLLKARALRHKGTAYYTYSTLKDEVGAYLKEGLELLETPSIQDYYLNNSDTNLVKSYVNMVYGFYYNRCLYQSYIQEPLDFTPMDTWEKRYKEYIKDHFKTKKGTLVTPINFKDIQDNLDKNIYFDEAIETYISQKVIHLHDSI